MRLSVRLGVPGHRRFSVSAPASAHGSLPLEGYRVLDMTRVLAGPYCTQILGDLGAEVIKIEHPVRGDDTRAWGPPYATYKAGSLHEGPGESAYFLGVNRNKKSLALSFQDPAGVEILHKLAAKCDILVENYIPGSLKKYGLDYETIHKINPALIYASITGYGQTGPYSQRPGYDVMVEAEFGLMHITGSRDGPPVKVGVAVTDMTTGLYTSNSIMAALLARARTGKGQHIDAALSDCQTVTLANIASSCLISGEKDTGRWGTAHPSIVPYRSFKTKDGDVLFGGGNDKLFGILCDGLGRPEWKDDAKYRVNASRVAHRDELEAEIEAITVTKTTQEWLDTFEGKGMPYAAVNDVQGALAHAQTKARNMVVEVDHEECGPIKLLNTPSPPTLGQHTDEILREHLGMDEGQVQALRQKGVMADDETPKNAAGNSAEGSPRKPAPAPAPVPKPGSEPKQSPGPEAGANPEPERKPSPPRPSPASTTSFSTTRSLYNPQFTAATQMILKRMKGEPSSLSAALSHVSHSPAVTANIPSATYEDVKRRLVMGMNTSTQMTMQMPAAPAARPSLPAILPAPRPAAPKFTGSTAGMSAIRKVTAGLTSSSKPTPIKAPAPKVLSSESKIKKPKPVTGPRGPHVKRKRTKPQPDDDRDNDASSTSSLSSPEPSFAPPPPESTTPLTPTPLTMTKSGRQVLKPAAYDPAAMDAASRRPRAPAHHYGKRTAEQALCLKCSRMHSPVTNQIVFCDGCDECWHQLCHDPWISNDIVQDQGRVWFCAPCAAKRERHAAKRQKVEQQQQHHHTHHHHPQGRGGNKTEKGSWAGKPAQQKRAYLSTLPQQELVGLLMASATTTATTTVPPVRGPRSIFAGTTTEGLFPRADAHPTGQINFVRKVAAAAVNGKGGKGGGGSQKEGSQEGAGGEEDEEYDPLAALWPRAGRGMYTRLPPDTEDEARLVDEGDFEAFSSIVYDDRGRKVEENGMKV
ncbi:CoA-transferase family III domain-containing protein [Chaetomium sp. MPI-CAGE-AT-0009]|nr:CoA-transferase family III domain-containing protein [Chaetomium sp. MPI-CAGE-AT-0009]